MKKIFFSIFALLFLLSAAACAPEKTESGGVHEKSGNILAAYFTRSGNTREIAEEIAARTGGDLFEISPASPYPESYEETLEIARQERAEDARPALSKQTLALRAEQYDAVFVGYPVWHGEEPRIVRSFFDAFGGFKGKSVYLFSTSASSGGSVAVGNLKESYPQTDFGKNLHLTSADLPRAQALVEDWLGALQIARAARVEMEIEGETIFVALADNAAAEELAARLEQGEMTLVFSDFAGAEKIAYPAPPLNVSGDGFDPEVGDIAIYKPWGNIAIFYRDPSGYSADLIYLGKIEGGGIGILAAQEGEFSVTLRLAGGR